MFQHVVIPILCGLIVIGLAVYLVRSFRRGGYGPPIQMPAWTRAGRLRTNASYEKHGWAKPYDDDGNLLPQSKRKLPTGSSR